MKESVKINNPIKRLILTAMLLALALVLSFLESLLPPIGTVPGVKLGLSNIAVMFVLLFVGRGQALTVTAAKSLFVLAVKGFTSGLISLTGGLVSMLAMILLLKFYKNASYLLLSITGGVMHNLGQLAAVSVILGGGWIWWYAPVLVISGVVAGSVTALLLRLIIPFLKGVISFEK